MKRRAVPRTAPTGPFMAEANPALHPKKNLGPGQARADEGSEKTAKLTPPIRHLNRIRPLRTGLLDQRELPRPEPPLYAFLMADRVLDPLERR